MQVLHDTLLNEPGITLLSIHIDDRADPGPHLAEHDLTFPVVEDGNAISKAYDVTLVPTYVVIDADGRIIYRRSGRLNDDARDEMLNVARQAIE